MKLSEVLNSELWCASFGIDIIPVSDHSVYLHIITADWLEMPGAIVIIIVVAPNLIANTFRGNWVGAAVCLAIGCYLLQEHIRASGGFRNAFTRANGISNTSGIVILLVYPVWYLITSFFWPSSIIHGWFVHVSISIIILVEPSKFVMRHDFVRELCGSGLWNKLVILWGDVLHCVWIYALLIRFFTLMHWYVNYQKPILLRNEESGYSKEPSAI